MWGVGVSGEVGGSGSYGLRGWLSPYVGGGDPGPSMDLTAPGDIGAQRGRHGPQVTQQRAKLTGTPSLPEATGWTVMLWCGHLCCPHWGDKRCRSEL
jgi:hypothetical protein